eukprot:gene7910-8727_t
MFNVFQRYAPKTYESVQKNKKDLIQMAGICAFVLGVSSYGFNLTFCVGPSMLPTLEESGSVVIVDIFSHAILNRDFQCGDVVIARHPHDPSKKVCKRVRATSGDCVMRRYPGTLRSVTEVIPAGHYWLAGDNFHNSNDSRSYGPVSEDFIVGRVLYKLSLSYPFVKKIGQEAPNAEEELQNFLRHDPLDDIILEQVRRMEAGKAEARTGQKEVETSGAREKQTPVAEFSTSGKEVSASLTPLAQSHPKV